MYSYDNDVIGGSDVIHWANEWMNEWMNEQMNKW